VARRLVGQVLTLGNAVLAVKLAVIGYEEDVGVVQLPGGTEGADDRADAAVDCPQGLELTAIALIDFPTLSLEQRMEDADEAGLVGDVALVIALRPVTPAALPASRGPTEGPLGPTRSTWGAV
jgi:hypothetical protein